MNIKHIFGVALILILSIATAIPVQAEKKEKEEKTKTLVRKGNKVPDFTVQMFDGSSVSISDLKGKVVLVNFWATWCPPCRMELARVQKEIIDRFKGQEFVFLPISREDSYEKIKAFREKNGYTFPMGMDPEGKIFSLFATSAIPRNFIINKKGRMAFIETGYSEKKFGILIEKIETALK